MRNRLWTTIQHIMQWILLLIILVIILMGMWLAYTPRYEVVVIDGCEYLATTYNGNRTQVHKANCPNHKAMP